MEGSTRRNERLRQLRLQRNWRLQDIADQLDTTITTVQRWERGTQQPSIYYLTKLCTLFGLSSQELGFEAGELVFSAGSEKVEVAPAPVQASALWTVPYIRNPYFMGRDDLINLLNERLVPPGVSQSSDTRQTALAPIQALKGLAGIGKTQVAIEYAYLAREQGRFTHILWIAASSEENILASFAAIAQLIPELRTLRETDQRLVTAVLRWLELCSRPWLLLIDNVEDLALLQAYLPRQGNGAILLTTRAGAVGSLATPIEVDNLSVEEGTRFLLKRAQRMKDESSDEIAEARRVAIALAQFPLALDQSAAYMEETGCSFSIYLDLYQNHRRILLSRRGSQATNYPDSVATTWNLSWSQLEQVNPAAVYFLRLCAFLAPDHIPEELITQGGAFWPADLREVVVDPLAFNQIVQDLFTYSLVKRLAGKELLCLHRLVQVVQREQMTMAEQRQWAERVVRAVHFIFPDQSKDVNTWSSCLRYLDQAEVCGALIRQYDLRFPEAAELLDRVGVYLKESAPYHLADPLLRQALELREQIMGPEHLATAQSLSNLASLYFRQGKHEQAERLLLRALRIREQNEETPLLDTAQNLHNLAVLYSSQGKFGQAEPLYARSNLLTEQAVGSVHEQMATGLKNLATVYLKKGMYTQAEPLYRQVLTILEQLVGMEHIRVSNTLDGLAHILTAQGQYAEAERLYRRSLDILERQVGESHALVADTLDELGRLMVAQGKYAEAEPFFRRALLIAEQQVGTEHEQVAYLLAGLADLSVKLGRYVEAELLYQRSLRIWKHLEEEYNPDMAVMLHGFATFSRDQGNYEQATELFQQALTIREHALVPDHLDLAATRYEFAVLKEAQGHVEEAYELYKEALRVRSTALGSDDPQTVQTRERFTALAQQLGRSEELE